MKNVALAALAALISMVLISSCYFEVEKPLPPKTGSDPAILGCWQSLPLEKEKSKEPGYLLFLKNDDNAVMMVVLGADYTFEEMYRCTVAEVDGEMYLNAQTVPLKDGREVQKYGNYLLAHYEIKGDRLFVKLLKEAVIKQAIENKQLAGTIMPGQYSSDVLVTASPEELTTFIKHQPKTTLLEDDLLLKAHRTDRLPNRK